MSSPLPPKKGASGCTCDILGSSEDYDGALADRVLATEQVLVQSVALLLYFIVMSIGEDFLAKRVDRSKADDDQDENSKAHLGNT